MGGGGFGGGDNFLIARIELSEGDVGADSVVEKDYVLAHKRYGAAQRG